VPVHPKPPKGLPRDENSLPKTTHFRQEVYNVNLPNFIPRRQQDKINRMDKRKKTRAKAEKA